MRKVIALPVYDRPYELGLTLNSLRSQMAPLDEYEMVASIDGGGQNFDEVLSILKTIDFLPVQIFAQAEHLGLNRNTFWAMDCAFCLLGVSHVVYLEDDFLLSPDAFYLVAWYVEHGKELRAVEGVEDIAAYCLCRPDGAGEAGGVFMSRRFHAWGFLMEPAQWLTYAKPAWCLSYKSWDLSVDSYMRVKGERVFCAFPELSRMSNTGRRGTHFTPDEFEEQMRGHHYQEARVSCPFFFTGLRETCLSMPLSPN